MPRKARRKSTTGVYHVMLRGINRQVIFEDNEDCGRFLAILKKCREQNGLRIFAWCLMSNHVHLLIHAEGDPLEIVLRRIASSYVQWFNLKYERSGHLFQERYKSEPVESEASFMRTLRYIIQNPMKAGLEPKPGRYRWNCYFAYAGRNDGLTDPELAVSIFKSHRQMLAYFHETNADEGMEPAEPRKMVTDNEAAKIVLRMTGCPTLQAFLQLNKAQREEFIRRLYGEHLSGGQIARLTGVPKSTVHRILGRGTGSRPISEE